MKNSWLVFSLTALLLAGSAFSQEHRAQSRTYSVLPGDPLNVPNDKSHDVWIRSEYPVQILAGECRNDYTVQWHCSFEKPRDLFIRDLRVPPIFRKPRANVITVIASEN